MCRASTRGDSERTGQAGGARGAPAAGAPAGTRVSDADREAVGAELRTHFAEGRLDVDEFSERLDEVWKAETVAELDHVLRDLPAPPRSGPARLQVTRTGSSRVMHRMAAAHTRTFLIVMAFIAALWLMSGGGGTWPLWPLAIWGFILWRHHRFADRWDRRIDRALAVRDAGRGFTHRARELR